MVWDHLRPIRDHFGSKLDPFQQKMHTNKTLSKSLQKAYDNSYSYLEPYAGTINIVLAEQIPYAPTSGLMRHRSYAEAYALA